MSQKLRNLLSTKRSNTLCAILKKPNFEKIAYVNQVADLVEFRVDLFDEKDLSLLKAYREATKIPCIFTLRKNLEPYLKLKPDFIDLDYKMACKKIAGINVIASQHDCEGTIQVEADIYKRALPVNSTLDAMKVIINRNADIEIATGELGQMTRILSPFTYAPVSSEDKTAEGQLLISELMGIYRYKEIDRDTVFYGLIGNPVHQSPGHIVHNFAFQKLGLNARYIKLNLKKDELAEALNLLKKLNFKGLSITIPHKEECAKILNHDFPINTLKLEDSHWHCFNTDGRAALDLILGVRKCKKMLILGNGGVARGIALEAKKRGLEVVMLARNEKSYVKSQPLSTFKTEDYDVLVNATPSENPINYDELQPGKLVLDVNLKSHLFLKAAREKRCDVIEGRELFFKQAAYQYEHWFTTPTF